MSQLEFKNADIGAWNLNFRIQTYIQLESFQWKLNIRQLEFIWNDWNEEFSYKRPNR